MKSGAHFEQRGDAALQAYLALGGFGDAGKNFEEGTFARSVAANDADDIAIVDIERNVVQRPEGSGRIFGVTLAERAGERIRKTVTQRAVLAVGPEFVAFAYAFDVDDNVAHILKAKRGLQKLIPCGGSKTSRR